MNNGLAWNYIQPVSLGGSEVSMANIQKASQDAVGQAVGRLKQLSDTVIANEANRQAEAKLERLMNVLNSRQQQQPQTQSVPESTPTVATSNESNGLANASVQKPAIQIQTPLVQQGKGLVKAPIQAAQPYMEMFKEASNTYGVPLDVLLAVAQTESDFNPKSVSSTGVRGIMQVTGDTYKGLGFTGDRADPRNSINAGAKLLSQLYNKYNDWDNAFYAYNGGHHGVTGIRDGNWGVWANNPAKIKEITNYAPKVNKYRQGWASYNG